jgi:D-xylose 1-dehydrogenase (NADP+, D-xylono-1,5-lactone-forming)
MTGTGRTALRWGVLSTARILDELRPGFAASSSAELAAIASRDGERAAAYAAEHAIPTAYGSYEELLADDSLDCVYVPLPNSLHAEWARAALEAGKHVLCEKPLTPTAAEAAALFELAEARGLVLMEAFMYRHHPKTSLLRRTIEEGRIGEPLLARMKFHFQCEDPATDIRFRPEMAGGALRDVGCYCVSLATLLAGEAPVGVGAAAGFAESGVDELFAGTLAFESGLVVDFDCGMVSPLDVGVEVIGTDGRIEVEMPWYAHSPPLSIRVTHGTESAELPAPGPNAYQLEIENFCAAVRGEEEPTISAEETLRNLETLERLLAAATTDRPIRA